MRNIIVLGILMGITVLVQPLVADEESGETRKVERAGTCQDAKDQVQYWCVEHKKVSVVVTGLECENAERNLKEACEGVKSEDHEYE